MKQMKVKAVSIPFNRGNITYILSLVIALFAFAQISSEILWIWRASVNDIRILSLPTTGSDFLRLDQHEKNEDKTTFQFNTESIRSRFKPKLLIAQYTGVEILNSYGNIKDQDDLRLYYKSLLNLTSKVNQAYTILWKHDYLLFRGIPYVGEFQNETCGVQLELLIVNGTRQHKNKSTIKISPGFDEIPNQNNIACKYNFSQSRATYNKIYILDIMLHDPSFRQKYDRLLILDSDAMMYDFSRDIADSFIPEEHGVDIETVASVVNRKDFVFVAHKTNSTDVNNTGSINIGVTLWNLRHPITPFVVQKWKTRSISRIRRLKDDDDQSPLQFILKEDIPQDRRKQVVLAVEGELGYGRGRFVKHFIRPDFTTWTTKGTATKNSSQLNNERLFKIQTALNEVCMKYNPICDR